MRISDWSSDVCSSDLPGLMSDGPKPLAPIHYYARLSQRLINAINAPTGEGRLFEVDMRLRPSGNAGPIASSLSGFRRYQAENAWTWEHLALTRARVGAGNPILTTPFTPQPHEVLTSPPTEGRRGGQERGRKRK